MAEMLRPRKDDDKVATKSKKEVIVAETIDDNPEETQDEDLQTIHEEIKEEKELEEQIEALEEQEILKKEEDTVEENEEIIEIEDIVIEEIEEQDVEQIEVLEELLIEEIEDPKEEIVEKIVDDEIFEEVSKEFPAFPEIKETKDILDDFEDLDDIEKDILGVAKSILKKKKYDSNIEVSRIEKMSPLVEQLYNKCIAKFMYSKGYSQYDIFSAIKSLEDKNWIVTNQRRTKIEIMENETLKEIYTYIIKNPGVHARDEDIQTQLNITRTPFIKHMMTLEAFELIRSEKIGRTLNYFPAELPKIFDDIVVLFRNPLIKQILFYFIDNPGEKITTIADEVDVFHGAIHYHIKNLIDMKIVFKKKVEKKTEYHPNEELLRRYNKVFNFPRFY